jgi:hypothetical protein
MDGDFYPCSSAFICGENYFCRTKAKRGRRMDSCWQMGQRDGVVRRSRFLKAKPQCLQAAGVI